MRFTGFNTLALALALSIPASQTLWAENWPNWRGPLNNGVCTELSAPTHWNAKSGENILWSRELPGPAGASPVVWNEHIFLTSVDEEGRLWLMAFSTKGQELWKQQIAAGNKNARGDEGNSASPSPVTDGRHVWTFMGTGDLACFDFNGQQVWKFDVQDRFGKFDIQFGMTSSPVLDGNEIYLQLIHGDGKNTTQEARLVALDKATGKTKWAVERRSDGTSENEHSYASPIIYQHGNLKLLLAHGCDYTTAHQLSNGEEVWRLGGLNPPSPTAKYEPTLRFVSSPSFAPDFIVVPTAKSGATYAIRPDLKGNLTANPQAHIWRYEKTPDVPSPLIHEGLVYLCMQDGNLHTLDAKTGELVYPIQRTNRQRHRSSPVAVNGHVYLTARDGKTHVIKTGRSYQVVAENDVGEDISASLAFSNGKLYIRSFKHLWAVGNP